MEIALRRRLTCSLGHVCSTPAWAAGIDLDVLIENFLLSAQKIGVDSQVELGGAIHRAEPLTSLRNISHFGLVLLYDLI